MPNKIQIDVYDGNTFELIGTFDSMYETAKFCYSYPGAVSRALAHNYSVNGYRVAEHGKPLVLPVPVKGNFTPHKTYNVYNGFTGEFLGNFVRQIEIAEAFNISSKCVSWAVVHNKPTHNLIIEVIDNED